ncbi:hypothetical protein ACLBYG_21940 [Methylobacterium sp. D53M]
MSALAPSLPDPATTNDIAGLLDGLSDYWLSVEAEASALVVRCCGGECLVLTHTKAGNRYGLEPSGEAVSAEAADCAIAGRSLVPEADGLLDAGTAQTWRAALCA